MNLQIFKTYSLMGLSRAVDVYNGFTQYTYTQKVMGYRFLFKFRHREPKICPTIQEIVDKIWNMIKDLNMFDEEKNDSKNEGEDNNKGEINKEVSKSEYISKKYRKFKSSDDKFKDENIVQELVDILLEYVPSEGEKLLKILRDSKVVANNDGVKVDGPVGTIYSDSQSVHQIRNKAVEISICLCRDYPGPKPVGPPSQIAGIMDIRNLLKSKAKNAVLGYAKTLYNKRDISSQTNTPSDLHNTLSNTPSSINVIENKIEDLMERFGYDNAEYGENFLEDIFISLWLFIDSHKYKQDLVQRLYEEMIEMYNYCSSGLLSHLINVIQGYSDKEEYMLVIPIEEQAKGVIYNYLNKLLLSHYEDEAYPYITSVIDEGLNNISLEHKEKYISFIRENIKGKTIEWKIEYGNDFIKHIEPLIDKYLLLK